VTKAGVDQLNTIAHTTTIYLNNQIAEYAQALADKMPGNLKCVYFVNSGSEANDLALLMARLYTGNYDVIALRNCYHGGVNSAMGLTAHSTWKFNYPHSFGVHHAMTPDPYRGPYGRERPGRGQEVRGRHQGPDPHTPRRARSRASSPRIHPGRGRRGGVPRRLPAGGLPHRARAGGVCIADEVQAGFGRTGTHYWGFETQGVIPDIVTMAKSIGNGAPLAAVVTTPEIAQTLAQRIHFNTFGGNPVSCAIGKAVLETLTASTCRPGASSWATSCWPACAS
jgi:alanine-glyoxylate transaminase/(R)-3-amino-2-methylpropionate-pyruvate transaminase